MNGTSPVADPPAALPDRRHGYRRAVAGVLSALLLPGLAATISGQMPDARSMTGIPRPVDDLPVGTVSVRVVRGDLANVVPDIRVDLLVAGKARELRTDAGGRAEFKGLAPSTVVRAAATLDGERLESEEFQVPSEGGVRLLLSGPLPGGRPPAGAASSAPVPGAVVFGGDTRIVMQFADDDLEVFYLLDIVNGGASPVKTEPLVLEMPPEAQGTTVLEGSSPQAVAQGRRVTISGPFAPGRTAVQVAYSLPSGIDRVRLAQRFPAALSQTTILVQKAGALTVTSPAIREQREMAEPGRVFLMGTGPGLAAGETVVVDVDGVPHTARWPGHVALGLAALALVVGAWAAIRPGPSAAAAARARLAARREQLLADVQRLDAQLQAGRIEARRHAAGREELLAELERIYGTLDPGPDVKDREMGRAG